MTVPLSSLADRGDFLEIVDEGAIGIALFWVTAPCSCRSMIWCGGDYAEAKTEAASWANSLGGLPVLDRRALQ